MNAKKIFRVSLIFILAFASLMSLAPITKVAADTAPDELASYTINIVPQADGTLQMSYMLKNYCAKSDWPGNLPYLQVGVPNENFTISDFGPKDGKNKVVNAESITSGGSWVQLDFDQNNLPKNGDCFDLYFSIVQNNMAWTDTANNQTTFNFIPAAWTFPIKVNTLTVTWALPADKSLLKVTEPSPTSSDATNMIWTWTSPAIDSTGMFHDYNVKLAYDPSAFQLSDAAKASSDSGNGGSGGSEAGGLSLFVIVVIIIVVVVILIVVVAMISSDGGYGGGGGGIFLGGGGGGDGGGHSGGGGLGGGGGGYSCACAGCACACACAGGGRVGCSRKAIGLQCLTQAIEEGKVQNEEKAD